MSKALAIRALNGVGDAALGQWIEHGSGTTVHVRRRVSADEQLLVGPVCDVRGTSEQVLRFERLLADAPHLTAYVTESRAREREATSTRKGTGSFGA